MAPCKLIDEKFVLEEGGVALVPIAPLVALYRVDNPAVRIFDLNPCPLLHLCGYKGEYRGLVELLASGEEDSDAFPEVSELCGGEVDLFVSTKKNDVGVRFIGESGGQASCTHARISTEFSR